MQQTEHFFDSKRIWSWFSLVLTVLVLVLAFFGSGMVKSRETNLLKHDLDQIIRLGSGQITEGNYREPFETYITRNKIDELSINRGNATLFQYGATQQEPVLSLSSSLCFTDAVSELNIQIVSCTRTNVVAVFLGSLIFIYFILLLCAYFYLKKLDENSTRQLFSLLKSVGVPIEDRKMNLSGVLSNVASVVEGYRKNKELEHEYIRLQAIAKISDQVSHDVRSPLAALEMILPTIGEIEETKRFIIRNATHRIRDIVNSLKHGKRSAVTVDPNADEGSFLAGSVEQTFLAPLIESIVSEKRAQFYNMGNVEIVYDQTEYSYGLFVSVEANHFERLISNLLNNAVESISSDKNGKVKVVVSAGDKGIVITISDNGKGIPEDVLLKLGNRGESHGKKDGSGLGVYHAKTAVGSWGGIFEISSEIRKGTVVKIILPKQIPPKWFVPRVEIRSDAMVVVFDDDQSIHQLWDERLRQKKFQNKGITVFHCTTHREMRKFYGEHFTDLENVLFLIDYEIIGQENSGIDLIEELGIQSCSIIVTSRFDDNFILDYCERRNVRMIPKPVSGFVPMIHFES